MSDRFRFGVDVLDYLFFGDVPRNSLVVLEGSGGSGKSILALYIAKGFLSRGEEVVYVELDDDVDTLRESFGSIGVDADKAVSEGKLYILDGFSFRMRGRPGKHPLAYDEVNPTNIEVLQTKILSALDTAKMYRRGLLVVDSLNEILAYNDVVKVAEFLRFLKANVAKLRKVFTLSVLHTSTDDVKAWARSLDYLVDGVIDTEVVGQPIPGVEIPIPLRQISVRKMKGVSHRTGWYFFTVDKEGIKPVVVRIKS